MAFKMKRKGFPMKGSPNKLKGYSSAMKQEASSVPSDLNIVNLRDIDDRALRLEESNRRGLEADAILEANPDMWEKVPHPQNEAGVYTHKETGETLEEFRRKEYLRKLKKDREIAADSGDTGEYTGEYKDLASIQRANLGQGL